MNRRNFFKTMASMVAATAVAPSAVVATQPDVTKPEKPNSDIFAAKKIKEGFLSTGSTALDEALHGGIPYLSNVIIAGEAGTGKNILLRDIHNANSHLLHKAYASWGEQYIMENALKFAYLYNTDHAKNYHEWSFVYNNGEKPWPQTTFEIIQTRFGYKNDYIYSGIGFSKLTHADVVIKTSLDSYHVVKNRFGKTGTVVKRDQWYQS